MTLRTVAALYIDPKGPYPKMEGVDCWDEIRDARLYNGPHPVVAHPPCGPWGRLRHMCTKQLAECGPIAVEHVRKYGGVLEHPAESKLWDFCGLPKSGVLDAYGGITLKCEQVHWGHVCQKRTWLYCVRCWHAIYPAPLPEARAIKCVSRDAKRKSSKLPRASSFECRATPAKFAEYLVNLARSVQS